MFILHVSILVLLVLNLALTWRVGQLVIELINKGP